MLDICLLGTGGMMPLPKRWLTSLMLRYNGKSILIDCGEGTQVSMRMVGWGFKSLDVICITHCHGDHIVGLPGLLATIGNSGRTEPLTIIGPEGIKEVVDGLRVIAKYLPYEVNILENPREVNFNINKVKTSYDCISVVLGIVMSFAFFGFGVFNAQFVKSLVQTKVGHYCGDYRVAYQLTPFLHVLAVQIQNVVAGDDIALLIHAQAAVCIAIVSKAHVQAIVHHEFLQNFDMGGAGIGIDVIAVGVIVDHVGLGTQGIKYILGNIPGGAVGAVQTHLLALEGILAHADQVADVAVSAGDMVHGPADLVPVGQGQLVPLPAKGHQLAVEIGFDQGDDALIHLLAEGIDELDAVVVVGVVGGGDHDAAVEILGPGHISHGGGGGHVEQVGIRAGGHQTAHQGVLEHVAGAAGVLADDDPGRTVGTAAALQLGVVPAQEAPHLPGMVRGKRAVRFAPKSVGTEIFVACGCGTAVD